MSSDAKFRARSWQQCVEFLLILLVTLRYGQMVLLGFFVALISVLGVIGSRAGGNIFGFLFVFIFVFLPALAAVVGLVSLWTVLILSSEFISKRQWLLLFVRLGLLAGILVTVCFYWGSTFTRFKSGYFEPPVEIAFLVVTCSLGLFEMSKFLFRKPIA